jgi:hypothetical protein
VCCKKCSNVDLNLAEERSSSKSLCSYLFSETVFISALRGMSCKRFSLQCGYQWILKSDSYFTSDDIILIETYELDTSNAISHLPVRIFLRLHLPLTSIKNCFALEIRTVVIFDRFFINMNAFYLTLINHNNAVRFLQTTLYRYFCSGGRGRVRGKRNTSRGYSGVTVNKVEEKAITRTEPVWSMHYLTNVMHIIDAN